MGRQKARGGSEPVAFLGKQGGLESRACAEPVHQVGDMGAELARRDIERACRRFVGVMRAMGHMPSHFIYDIGIS